MEIKPMGLKPGESFMGEESPDRVTVIRICENKETQKHCLKRKKTNSSVIKVKERGTL